MSDEQKIEGVPDGFRISQLIERKTDTRYGDHPGVYYEAILERIPKPKQSVIVAEWDVVKGLAFTAPRAFIAGNYRQCDRDA